MKWQPLAVISAVAIVLALSLTVMWWSGEYLKTGTLNGRAWLFLSLSGLATAVSWVAYFKTRSMGSAILGERLSWRGRIGVMLIVAGSFLASSGSG